MAAGPPFVAKAECEQQSTGRLRVSSHRLLIESFVNGADSKYLSGWMEYDDKMSGEATSACSSSLRQFSFDQTGPLVCCLSGPPA